MTDERSKEVSVSLSRYPGPLCVYEHAEEKLVVGHTNTTFEQQLADVEAGTPMTAVFDSPAIDIGADTGVERLLLAAEQFPVTTENAGTAATSKEYLAQPVPPEDGTPGTVVFVETTTAEKSFGVNNVASVVSHELRNPLEVARTRLRAGRELDDDDHFDHVAQAHDRMERIIQDVLTLARGEEVVDPTETVALGRLAQQAWETVETGDATLSVPDTLPTTTADPDRVSRLFENLFRNCVEHGATGERSDDTAESGVSADVRVTVGRLADEPSDGFYVADDGTGIPASARERVFEPGYSSDDHGTGLGLAIVDRIAALHDWTTTAAAAEGGGARIEVHGVEPRSES
jgi:nitrogen fixation/metabolism regulation signal transduction histidine kinase